MFNLAYSLVKSNEIAPFNMSCDSFGSDQIILSNVTKEVSKYTCTVGGIELPIEKFYIFRRNLFLVTIVVQMATDVWDLVSTMGGSEVVINWESPSFNGEMANSLLQDISYKRDSKRRVTTLHCFRNKREIAQHKFVLDAIREKTLTVSGELKSVKVDPQPKMSPGDTVTIAGIDYIVDSVKITADRFKSLMVVHFG